MTNIYIYILISVIFNITFNEHSQTSSLTWLAQTSPISSSLGSQAVLTPHSMWMGDHQERPGFWSGGRQWPPISECLLPGKLLDRVARSQPCLICSFHQHYRHSFTAIRCLDNVICPKTPKLDCSSTMYEDHLHLPNYVSSNSPGGIHHIFFNVI